MSEHNEQGTILHEEIERMMTSTPEAQVLPRSDLPFRCCPDWEVNKYDDSDWLCTAYDPKEDKLISVLTGSTRFASSLRISGVVQAMTDEMLPRAKAALVKLFFGALQVLEERAALSPKIETMTKGTRVRFLESHRCMKKSKAVDLKICEKCGGSGKWINPKRSTDVRECFACRGSGNVRSVTRTKVKGEDGSQVWEQIDAGAAGVVQGSMTFGKFYRNGYNQPDRHNTTFFILLDDGREVQSPGAKLRLDREPATPEQIQKAAETMAEKAGFARCHEGLGYLLKG